MIKPTNVIYPEGGEPLYEAPGSGLMLTAQDFAVAYGYESTGAFLDHLKEPEPYNYTYKTQEEDEIDG